MYTTMVPAKKETEVKLVEFTDAKLAADKLGKGMPHSLGLEQKTCEREAVEEDFREQVAVASFAKTKERKDKSSCKQSTD